MRQALRDTIIDRLRSEARFADYWIDKFDDEADAWVEEHLSAADPSMIVSYAGTREAPGDENDPGRMGAVHVVVFERSEDAGLASIDAIEDAVHGLRTTVQGEVYRWRYRQDSFVGEINAWYQYEVQLMYELL